MSDRHFSLQPFPSSSPLPDIKIEGNIARSANILTINYQLIGDRSQIEIRLPAEIPLRKHELWEETCFEFFLGIKDSSQYWEFNLSPTGHWNIYCFKDYRQGMEEETAFSLLPFRIEVEPNSLQLTLEFDLERLISVNQALEVAISAVIKPKDSEVTYWALTHPGSQADFHRRDSFTINL